MADVALPQLGETVTEGTITRWFKQVGDTVAADEALYEVSTDKVDSEVPCPVGGVITEIRVAEGETVDVGTVLAVIDAPDGAPPVTPSPVAQPAAEAAPPTAESEPASGTAGGGHLLSPVVRRLLREHGMDPADVPPTGPGGRLTRADVERFIQTRGIDRIETAAPAPSLEAAPAASVPFDVARTATVVPFSNIRRRTAEHMVASKQTSPHAYSVVEVDYENVERARRPARAQWKATEGFSLTYLPFICRAVIDALDEFPHLNASVGDDELVIAPDVNLGIAVDLDFEGLLAPVVRNAETKRLRAIAREIVSLADRARAKKLSVDEVSGGTFTITNNGSFGTALVLPIINQPQVAILSTDAITRKPVAVSDGNGNEAITVHSVGMLALAWDHRCFDGSYAGAFLSHVKEILETRNWEAEL